MGKGHWLYAGIQWSKSTCTGLFVYWLVTPMKMQNDTFMPDLMDFFFSDKQGTTVLFSVK